MKRLLPDSDWRERLALAILVIGAIAAGILQASGGTSGIVVFVVALLVAGMVGLP